MAWHDDGLHDLNNCHLASCRYDDDAPVLDFSNVKVRNGLCPPWLATGRVGVRLGCVNTEVSGRCTGHITQHVAVEALLEASQC